MWINELSIDKRYGREFDYILKMLSGIKNLSYTKEITKDRYIFSMATADEYEKQVKNQIFDIVKNVILVFIKRDVIFDGVSLDANTFTKVAIVASITHFDNVYEEKYLAYQMQDISDYNIDAIYNFRLKKLISNWEELKEMTSSLLAYADNEDLTYIASFMNATSYERIGEVSVEELDEKLSLYTKKPRKNIPILPIYSNFYFNLLDALIRVNPKEVLLDNVVLPEDMLYILKKLVNVKFN